MIRNVAVKLPSVERELELLNKQAANVRKLAL
jgi:hypothetical protein